MHSATVSTLHSSELIACVNLALYTSEQAELIHTHAPVVAAPTRTSRKRKSRATADTCSDPSSTSLQLLKSVELLRATIDSLMTPYGYTMQSSHDTAVESAQAASKSSHSPLSLLPQHSIDELINAQHATHGAAAAVAHDKQQKDENGEEEEEEDWSDEDDDSDEAAADGPLGGILRFHQRMDDEHKRPSHGRHSRDALFDSTDDDEDDEEYVAEEGDEEKAETAEREPEEEPKQGETKQNTLLPQVRMEVDDDIESGKDEADEERVRRR